MNESEHQDTDDQSNKHTPLEEAAAEGQLPGVEAAEDAAERGDTFFDAAATLERPVTVTR